MSKPTFLNARLLTILAGATLVAVAGTAAALPLPISLGQQASTPVGTVDAGAYGTDAHACVAPSLPPLPALPAVPAVPLPLPIGVPAVPALPTPQANAKVCADAGLDGVHADASADAMGMVAYGTEADVDTSQQADAADEAAGGIQGFFQGIAKALKFW